jgi:ABC-type transport system involved in multi-copper enzyme maturation permease subunit
MATATISPVARLWHVLAGVPAAMAGPILTKELRVSSRRRRNYVLRGVYLAAMTVFVVLVWINAVRWGDYGDYASRIISMARAGMTVIACIAWFQFIAIQIITVIMLSTSISEEVYAKTLGVLMTTPINSFQIVVGKLFSKILQLLILLAASLPMLAVLRVLGGVPWDFVVSSLCITLTTALLVASVTMFFSILFRWAFVSILMSLGALAVFYGLLPLIAGLFMVAMELHGDEITWPVMTVFMNYNPFAMMTALTVEMFEPRAFSRGPVGTMFFFAWWVNCLVSLGLASLILAACVAMVRRVGLRMVAGATGAGPSSAAAIAVSAGAALAPGQRQVAGLPPRPVCPGADPAMPGAPVLEPVDASAPVAAAPAKPAFAAPPRTLPPPRRVKVRQINGSPIIWRELRSTWLKRGVLYWVFLGVGLWLLLLVYGLIAWAEHDTFRYSTVHVGFTLVYTVIAALATCVLAATNITSEKESRSWELLLCTPLGDWHILLAKFVGAMRRCMAVWLLPIVHILLFTVAGYSHPALLPMYLLIAGGVVVLLAGAGLYFGSRFRRTTTAVILNISLALGLWLALPIFVFLLVQAMPGQAYESDFHDVAGWFLDANPVYQAGVVCDSLAGADNARGNLSGISFHWTAFGDRTDFGESLAYLAFLASLNVALGALLAWRAKCQFRKRWF